jgi:C1A family cysteine protease
MSAQDFQSKVLMDSSLIDMDSYEPESSDESNSNNGNSGRFGRGRPDGRRMLRGEEELQSTGRKLSQLPTVVDWVAAKKVTAVKNQGSCGECSTCLWSDAASWCPSPTLLTFPP